MNENPYQVPTAPLERPSDLGPAQLHEPRAVDSGRGVGWLTEGWKLFKKAPGPFALMGLIFTVLVVVVSLIPLLGGLAVALFWPHANAGFYLAAKHAHEDKPVTVGDLFQPFQNMGSLMGLGGLYLAASIVLGIVMVVFMLGGMGASGVFSGDQMDAANLGAMGMTLVLMVLVALALSVPMIMAFLFAPVLVHQHGLQPVEAIKTSFSACLKNLVPFLVWGLVWFGVMILLVILNIIPILGQLIFIAFMVVAMPLFVCNLYLSYRDILID